MLELELNQIPRDDLKWSLIRVFMLDSWNASAETRYAPDKPLGFILKLRDVKRTVSTGRVWPVGLRLKPWG